MDWGDGAGFINDSVSEDPQRVINSVSIAGDDKNKSIAAVSVSQIIKLTRPNEGLIIHGKKVYHVNLVAYVYDIVDINQQKIHVMVDDHSGGGPLEVNHIFGDTGTPGDDPSLSMFNDDMAQAGPDQPKDIHNLTVGDYIRCIGVVKYTQDKANVVAYNLRIIEDPNEVTMHIAEVIRDSLFYRKMQACGGVVPSAVVESSKPMPQNTTTNNEFGRLSTRDKHLVNFLKSQAAGDKGIHIDYICKNFTAFKKPEIVESLVALSNEGICWQSDDEDVWCIS